VIILTNNISSQFINFLMNLQYSYIYNPYDLDKGYEYDIKEGDPFIIPLSVERYFEE